MNDLIKIGFEIEDSALGSTLANIETMWAKKIGDDEYELSNIPFDAYGVSMGDIVSVTPSQDGMLMYNKTLKYSGHSTFRFKSLNNDSGGYTSQLIERINRLGCGSETSGVIKNFVAIDVPPNVGPDVIADLLLQEFRKEKIDFEEASVPAGYISRKS